MAQTRRGYIFCAFLLSVLSLLLTIVSISSDSWIVSSARVEGQAQDSNIRYGLFRGVFDDRAFATTVTSTMYIPTPPVISFIFYVFVVLTLCLQLTFAAISALLTVINATKNPTEPMFGLPGCRLANIVASILGVIVLLMFGIYWATSGLQGHLAFSFIALEFYEPDPGLGYSYWLLIVSVASSIASVALIQLRSYLLERDPPPPTLKVENHSDGTIFLY